MNYLIVSNFYRLNNKLINDIVGVDSEIIKMDLNVNSIEEILEEVKYNSLFDDKKNIVVYNCNLFSSSSKIDNDEVDLLIAYLNNPNPNNNLIFIQCEGIDNRKKIVKLIKEHGKLLDYNKIKYNDLIRYVNDYIKDNEWNINSDIVNYLVRNFNNNYDLICNELDKVKLAFPNQVSLEEAKKIISNNISDNIFKFVDQVINKNLEISLKLLKDLKTYKVEPSVIINMIYREFRFMYLYKVASLNNINIESVFSGEGVADWQLSKIVDNSRRYNLEDICKTIKLLSDTDYKYKSGKLDRNLVIETFMLEFIY